MPTQSGRLSRLAWPSDGLHGARPRPDLLHHTVVVGRMRLRLLALVYLVRLQIVNVEAMMSESERQIESDVPPDR